GDARPPRPAPTRSETLAPTTAPDFVHGERGPASQEEDLRGEAAARYGPREPDGGAPRASQEEARRGSEKVRNSWTRVERRPGLPKPGRPRTSPVLHRGSSRPGAGVDRRIQTLRLPGIP